MKEVLILSFIATIVTFFALLSAHKKFCVDEFRQRIFKVRDDLFDYAANGNIAFDNVSYLMTRTYLNGAIRFAERMTLVKLIVGSRLLKHHKSSFEKDLVESLKKLNDEQRNHIQKSLSLSTDFTIMYLAKKNFIVVVTFALFRCLGIVMKVIKSTGVQDKLTREYQSTYTDAIYFEGASSNTCA